ncbi:hypothetical protein EON66_01255 [archaeon]|nr:MAG: hypothetical protein EON66_01255 [archaeon]
MRNGRTSELLQMEGVHQAGCDGLGRCAEVPHPPASSPIVQDGYHPRAVQPVTPRHVPYVRTHEVTVSVYPRLRGRPHCLFVYPRLGTPFAWAHCVLVLAPRAVWCFAFAVGGWALPLSILVGWTAYPALTYVCPRPR